MWPDQFRTIVAGQDRKVAPEVMGRDAAGQTVHHPPIRFVGGRSWVGMVADPGYEQLLLQHAGAAVQAASRALARPLAVDFEEHQFGVERSHTPVFYRALNVAFKRRSEKAKGEDVGALFSQRLVAALERQALRTGLDCPIADELEVANVQVPREMGMMLHTEGLKLLPSVEFTMFAELRGFWFAGNLSARGYGRIVPAQLLARRRA